MSSASCSLSFMPSLSLTLPRTCPLHLPWHLCLSHPTLRTLRYRPKKQPWGATVLGLGACGDKHRTQLNGTNLVTFYNSFQRGAVADVGFFPKVPARRNSPFTPLGPADPSDRCLQPRPPAVLVCKHMCVHDAVPAVVRQLERSSIRLATRALVTEPVEPVEQQKSGAAPGTKWRRSKQGVHRIH